MQRRERGVEFNPRPMAREHRIPIAIGTSVLNRNVILSNRDRLALQTRTHRCSNSPDQQSDLDPSEWQDRPEPLGREETRHEKGRRCHGTDEDACRTWRQGIAASELKAFDRRRITVRQRAQPRIVGDSSTHLDNARRLRGAAMLATQRRACKRKYRMRKGFSDGGLGWRLVGRFAGGIDVGTSKMKCYRTASNTKSIRISQSLA